MLGYSTEHVMESSHLSYPGLTRFDTSLGENEFSVVFRSITSRPLNTVVKSPTISEQ